MKTLETLTRRELELLKRLKSRRESKIEDLVDEVLTRDSIMALLELLKSKNAVRVVKKKKIYAKPTREGLEYAEKELPERRIVKRVVERGGELLLSELLKLGFKPEEVKIGLGWVRKKKWGEISKGLLRVSSEPPRGRDEELLKKVVREGILEVENLPDQDRCWISILESRGLVEVLEDEEVKVEITSRGVELLEASVEAISEITPEVIKSRIWEVKPIKPYNVTAQPPIVYPGKKHFFVEFIEKLRRLLLSMGFTEMEGPYVELEFWNFDILFQPQDHPAREVHDTFWLEKPSNGFLEDREVVERVKRVHESGGASGSKGWRYSWDENVAKRLILRTQTTAVSARYLYRNKKPPLKAFSISRVFRPDRIDAKHLPEFHQFEGIVMDEGLTFRDLLGIVSEFFYNLGIERLKFKPGYFPFTEPSVEGYIYHPRIGWVECFGAGMFRPEVLEAIGVEYPVAAWGMGVERIAMIYLEINDIRDLYSRSLSFLRGCKLSRVWQHAYNNSE